MDKWIIKAKPRKNEDSVIDTKDRIVAANMQTILAL